MVAFEGDRSGRLHIVYSQISRKRTPLGPSIAVRLWKVFAYERLKNKKHDRAAGAAVMSSFHCFRLVHFKLVLNVVAVKLFLRTVTGKLLDFSMSIFVCDLFKTQRENLKKMANLVNFQSISILAIRNNIRKSSLCKQNLRLLFWGFHRCKHTCIYLFKVILQ